MHTLLGLIAIERLRLGQRVRTVTESERRELGWSEPPELIIDPHRWRAVRLVLRRGQPDQLEVDLLRPLSWLQDNGAEVGHTVLLDMPEMGAAGLAEVLAVLPCPTIEDGAGRLVTALFRHRSGEVLDLVLEGEPEPIGVTASHPFWSIDRGDWVSAGELQNGERVWSNSGPRQVKRVGHFASEEAVYNVEVEGEHCYRVGKQGALVHNASASELAREAGKLRSQTKVGGNWGDLARGIHNIGKIRIQTKTGEAESELLISRSKHSEEQAIEYAESKGILDCGTVKWLFTERSPCLRCNQAILGFRAKLRDAGRPDDFQIIYLVIYDETRQYEAEMSSASNRALKWDPYLLSLSPGSYQSRDLFFLNIENWRNSDWQI